MQTINITHPHLIKHFVNKEDAYKYSYGHNNKILIKCPDCGHEKKMVIRNLLKAGFGCPRCSDGISYPEKLMLNVLEQLGLIFKTQLSKTTYKWCGKYKYDFYINIGGIDCIIETHGIQHYRENRRKGMLLNEVKENDKLKEKLAKDNGIENYIVLDCRYSELELIKRSIMHSKLPNLLDFKENDMDWLKCHKHACSSFVKKSCDLWNDGIRNTLDIANILKIGRSTVIRYLNQGAKAGWCNYEPKQEIKKGSKLRLGKGCKAIVCLTTGETFKSQKEACIKYNIGSGNLWMCCNHKKQSAGKHPINGEKLVWVYA